MSFERPAFQEEHREEDEGRLNESEAHDEANMLRARVGASPELGGRIPEKWLGGEYFEERKVTPQEYDEALDQIEEWRKEIAESSMPERVLQQIYEQIHPITNGNRVALAAEAVGSLILGGLARKEGGDSFGEGVEQYWREHVENDLSITRFEKSLYGAETMLREMKKAGNKFGKREIQHDTRDREAS